MSGEGDVREEDLEDPRQIPILAFCVPDERAPNATELRSSETVLIRAIELSPFV